MLLLATHAHANPLELVGLTSRHAGQANTGVASADDVAALYYNPAGLAVAPGKDLAAGFVIAHATRADLAEPHGLQLAMRAPLPLRGALAGRIVVGAGLHLLGARVARIVAPGPDQPHDDYWDRMARTVVLPGIGVRLVDDLWIGAAVDVLAGLSGRISASEGITRALEARVDERIGTIARVVAGASWRPSLAWRVGLVYRQRFEVPFQTEARTIVGGEPIDLDLRATGLYAPHTIIAGGAWTGERLRIAVDAGWAQWSAYPGPYVQVDSRLPLVGEIAGMPPVVSYSDAILARAGVETRRTDCGPLARAGYAFQSEPGTHHTLALGGGWQWPRAGVRLDAHAQWSFDRVVAGGLTVQVGL